MLGPNGHSGKAVERSEIQFTFLPARGTADESSIGGGGRGRKEGGRGKKKDL